MQGFRDEAALENTLSHPSEADIAVVRSLPGNFLILGAGGKMGPTLAMRIQKAINAVGSSQQVVAVSRFSEARTREALVASLVNKALQGDIRASSLLIALIQRVEAEHRPADRQEQMLEATDKAIIAAFIARTERDDGPGA